MKILTTKDGKYKSFYKVTIFYTDNTKQRTGKYSPAFDAEEDAVLYGKEHEEEIIYDDLSSDEAALTKSSLTVSYGKSYVIEKRYTNFGKNIQYKMKFSVAVKNPKASCSKQKTIYTPWLNSEKECLEYAEETKISHGVQTKNIPVKTVDEEIWMPVPEYEKYYEVSSIGRLKSKYRKSSGHKTYERIINGTISRGYIYVVLNKPNSKPKNIALHRLVLMTFQPSFDGSKIVCHKNGDKLDNSLSNLYWGTYQENTKDLFMSDTATQAKLKISDIKEIKNELKNNYYKGCVNALAKKYKVSYTIINNIYKNKTWKWVE